MLYRKETQSLNPIYIYTHIASISKSLCKVKPIPSLVRWLVKFSRLAISVSFKTSRFSHVCFFFQYSLKFKCIIPKKTKTLTKLLLLVSIILSLIVTHHVPSIMPNDLQPTDEEVMRPHFIILIMTCRIYFMYMYILSFEKGP